MLCKLVDQKCFPVVSEKEKITFITLVKLGAISSQRTVYRYQKFYSKKYPGLISQSGIQI
jgi:hypothetical protein